MTYNVNITGTLTNNNGVLSGFSSSDYATINVPFNPAGNDWVIQLGFTTGSSVSGDQFFLGQPDNSTMSVITGIQNTQFFIALRDENGGDIVFWDNIYPPYLETNTKYYVRISYSSSTGYEIKYSTDKVSWNSIWSNSSTTTVGMPSDLVLGNHANSSSPFLGSIDLNDCYIKVSGTTIWEGVSQAYNGIHIQLRRDTLSNWTTANPTLYDGEVGLITDQAKYVVGDGSSTFSSLNKHNMDTDTTNLANKDLSNLSTTGIETLLSTVYPIGSIYISASGSSTCPLATLMPNATWVKEAEDRVLQGSSSTHTANTTIAAGLPNVTGTFGAVVSNASGNSGCFAPNAGTATKAGQVIPDTGQFTSIFNASLSNSIYGNSTTVQPSAYVVDIWRRTA